MSKPIDLGAITAYGIWLDAGNSGTIDDFLASLKGEKGDPGRDGKDGAPGADGAPGKNGDPGTAATLEITGVEVLQAGSSPEVVENEGSTEQARSYTLKVPQGPQGEQGPAGPALAVTNTAAVGQTIKVAAVDDAGQPTAWEAADMTSGEGATTSEQWVTIADHTVTAEEVEAGVTYWAFDRDVNGNTLSCDCIRVMILPIVAENTTLYALASSKNNNANYCVNQQKFLKNNTLALLDIILHSDSDMPYIESKCGSGIVGNGGATMGTNMWALQDATNAKFERPFKGFTLRPNSQLLEGSWFKIQGRVK